MKLFMKMVITLLILFPAIVSEFASLMNSDKFESSFSILAAEAQQKRKTRKTPAMREKIYNQIARAQKLSDDGDVEGGLAVLDALKSRSNQINSYEKAMMWNFYGFIYYGKDDMKSAIQAFDQVVAQDNIPESFELSTLVSLAQLSMAVENYQQAIGYIDQWQETKKGELSEVLLALKSNAFYVMKDYENALNNITSAINLYYDKNKVPKESWLVLQRALHYELKQPTAVTDVSEQLVRHYPKAKYWLELANMYGEVGKESHQLAVMEAAYQQGFVTKASDIQSLAQLYYFSGAPYKSAVLLEHAIKDNVLKEEPKTLKFLAQAWTSAKESEKAVPVLIHAAALSEDGNLDARLAEILIDLERWSDVLVYTKKAEEKGKLDNPGNIFVASGIAYFNLKDFPSAIAQFKLAKEQKRQAKIAGQWLRYAERENQNAEQFRLASSSDS